ncbi:ribosome biogenesis protein MAK21 [Dissophora ornata]|nr:ribosome biogenesis protein MAK21 [Dissophora ornata]
MATTTTTTRTTTGPSANGSIPKNMLASVKAKPGKVVLTFKPSPQWYSNELEPLEDDGKTHHNTETTVTQKTTQATRLLEEENVKYDENPNLSSSDKNFVSTIMTSGTLNDRVSALTLLVQESPLHTTKSLDKLMAMAEKKSRTEAVKSVESLKDLFIGGMLPNRKLKYFQDRPLTHPKVTNGHLILWIFEDYLKKTFWKFVQLLKILSDDPVVHVRHRMLGFISELMTSKPEQENTLLELLVNKMGDKENKVSAKASYEIQQLLRAHPGMSMIVVREIERLLMRPRISERAQYYAIITLNQTILNGRQVDLANKLIDIYFVFFKRMLGDQESQVKKTKDFLKENRSKVDKKRKKDAGKTKGPHRTPGEVLDLQDSEHSKMVAAVLTGVNRAFPFAKVDDKVFASHMDIIFRITHTGTFNTSIQALRLIFRVSTIQQNTSDRFYRTLYESLLDPRLILTSKQSIYLNLLFDALQADQSLPRIKAFVKRLVQSCAHHQPPYICGAFFLISKLMSSKTGLSSMVSQPEDDDEENFKDAPEVDDKTKEEKEEKEEGSDKKIEDTKNADSARNNNKYDGRKREPLYSNADKTCLWEMTPFLSHFHPTVSLYAAHILSLQPIEGKPEFYQHALIHFLNRMVYKNAKKQRDDVNTALGTKGSSIMQPMAAHRGMSIMLKKNGVNDVNVNTEAFWQKKEEDIPVDQIFFHKYFTQKKAFKSTGKQSAKSTGSDDDEADFTDSRKSKGGKDVEDEDEGSDMDEDEVWNAMMSDMPKDAMEDVDEDDDDLSDGDLEELMLSDLEDEEEGAEADSEEEEEEIDEESFGKDEANWKDDEGDDEEANMFMDEEDDMMPSDEEAVAAEESDEEEKGRDKKRRKKVALPMFASMEDYAHLIDQDDSE